MGGYQLVRRVIGLGSRHPLQIAFLRIAIGIYLVILTAVLYSAGVRDAWPWVTGVSALVTSSWPLAFCVSPSGTAR